MPSPDRRLPRPSRNVTDMRLQIAPLRLEQPLYGLDHRPSAEQCSPLSLAVGRDDDLDTGRFSLS